jgi:hypothetical protein
MSAAGRPKGQTKSGGRQPGSRNKATAEIKALAQEYAPAALKEAARLAKEAVSETARIAAIALVLDRAYGKAAQSIEANITGAIHFVPDPRDKAL